jgi:hypothetical protein
MGDDELRRMWKEDAVAHHFLGETEKCHEDSQDVQRLGCEPNPGHSEWETELIST